MTINTDIVAVAKRLINPATTYYRLGAEVSLDQRNFNLDDLGIDGIKPLTYVDCSEFTEAVAWVSGVLPKFPDGAWQQAAYCRRRGTDLSITEALTTPGALLFRDFGPSGSGGRGNHVGISLGDGTCIEARSSRLTPQCGIYSAMGRGWNYAARYPDVQYGAPPLPPPLPPAAAAVIFPGASVGVGQYLDSGSTRLIFQEDRNVVIYANGVPIWATQTQGTDASSLVNQTDGNLVLYTSTGRPLGASMTFDAGSSVAVQHDGNMVIVTADGRPVWASKSSPWTQIS